MTALGTQSPREAIAQIDKLIDANRVAVFNRLHCRPESAFDWHRAWGRCPDLRTREYALYRQRGILQRQRDAEDHTVWLAAERKRKAAERAAVRGSVKNRKPCPTCGSLMMEAA